MVIDALKETGFTLSWSGVIVGLFCLTILILKAKEQIQNMQNMQNMQKSVTDATLKKDTIILLIAAFGCTICTLSYCSFYAIFATIPSRFNLQITTTFCKNIAIRWPGTSWYFARYFFYIFMLWRIQASFREPQSLVLSKYTIRIFLIFIHLWFIMGAIIPISLSPSQLMPGVGCIIKIFDLFPGFTTADLRTIWFVFDIILTVGLGFLFIHRLYKLTSQNERVNKYKIKTLTLGIIASSTSIILVVANLCIDLDKWRYFVSIDCIINLLCVVFTYKFTFLTTITTIDICDTCCKKNNNHAQNNCDYNQTHIDSREHESTTRVQPDDSIVWNMLVRSNDHPMHKKTNEPHGDTLTTDSNGSDETNDNTPNESNGTNRNPQQNTTTIEIVTNAGQEIAMTKVSQFNSTVTETTVNV